MKRGGASWSFSTHRAATNNRNSNGTEVIVSVVVIVEMVIVTVIGAASRLPSVVLASFTCTEMDGQTGGN